METTTVYEEWEITGDVPGGKDLLYQPALEHFAARHAYQSEKLKPEHEVATKIGKSVLAVREVNIEPQEDGRTYIARHKKEIIGGLTVAAVLGAAYAVHVRRKR